VADPVFATPWANTLNVVVPADTTMLNEPEPTSPECSASVTAAGLLLAICTVPPPNATDGVTVIGICRFCPTVPPVIVMNCVEAGVIVSERPADAVCWGVLESFTVTFTVYTAAVPLCGVPLITPAELSIESPAGNPEAVHV
jgi:hypothetical protein